MSDGNELQREDLVAALAELPLATRESDIGLDRPLKRVYLSHLDLDHPAFYSIRDWWCGERDEPDLPAFREHYGDPDATCLSRCWGDASKWLSAPASRCRGS